MNVQTLWGSDEILYKLHMVWIEQIILNYGTTQLRRQFAIDSKAVLYSHGSNGGSEAASAGVNFYTIKLIKRASLDLGVTFASKRGLRTWQNGSTRLCLSLVILHAMGFLAPRLCAQVEASGAFAACWRIWTSLL